MAKQTFTAAQVLTAAQMTSLQGNDYNQTVSVKTASAVLVAADVGTTIEMNAAGATTITVNTSLFAAGDTLTLQNKGAGVCTITAGTATVSTAGSLALVQYAGGTLYFISAGVAVFFASGATAAAGGTPAFVGCIAYGALLLAFGTTNTAVSELTTELVDTDGFHDTSSNTSRMTIPSGKNGKYRMELSITFNANDPGVKIFAYKNGAAITEGLTNGQLSLLNYTAAVANAFSVGLIVTGVATDYFEFFVVNGGATKTVDKARYSFQYLGA